MGQTLLAYRKARGLSQQAVADHLGISKESVCRWELDHRMPGIDDRVALSRLLYIPLPDLLPEAELGRMHPTTGIPDPSLEKLVRLWPHIGESQRDIILLLAAQFRRDDPGARIGRGARAAERAARLEPQEPAPEAA